jgi:transcriptional regulator with PAS, ATPase and Fis domain
VNCAALPDTLLESELFGYKKGAFTDAKADKKGLFEMAQGGSILLDEIGEMKLTLQSKLLRVLEERTVRHIGGSAEIPIDATVIATTNRDLSAMVQQGEFRMDLFYRLNAFNVHIPPLRERPDDISALSNYYLTFFSTKYAKSPTPVFSPEAEALIRAHRWSGNVRELKNVIERLVVLGTGHRILPEQLPKEIVEVRPPAARSDGQPLMFPDGGMSLEGMEKEMIRQALERTNRNKAKAARLLGISYDTLRYQVKKFGLE